MASSKTARRTRIRRGIRSKISGTPERPRLAIFRSNKSIYAQLVDDVNGVTIAGASTDVEGIKDQEGNKSDLSRLVGMEIAKRAKEKGIEAVVFDRSGYKYHGRVKALAEGAREGGLTF